MQNEKVVVVDISSLIDYPASLKVGKSFVRGYGVAKLNSAIEHVQQSDKGCNPEQLLTQSLKHLFMEGEYSEKSVQKNLSLVKDTLEQKWEPALAHGAIGILHTVIESRWPLAFISDEEKMTEKVFAQLARKKLRFDISDHYSNLAEIGEEYGSLTDVIVISRNLLKHLLPVLMKRSQGFLVTSEGFTQKATIEAAQLSHIPSGNMDQASEWLKKVIKRKKMKKGYESEFH